MRVSKLLARLPLGVTLLSTVLLVALVAVPSLGADHLGAPRITMEIANATQGPLWPPSELTNADGDFVVIGISLVETPEFPGFGFPFFSQAVLVSKDSRPPFNPDGTRNFSNWFLAGYDIVRPLDLSDLDMELYTLSVGPKDDSGARRIPAEGDSLYNLNTGSNSCPEIFPSAIQEDNYTRPRYRLNEVPIWGFQGDQIIYDHDTGEVVTPVAKGGSNCPDGCEGENIIDFRPITQPVTLGQWLQAKATLTVTLADYREDLDAYTAADFKIKLKDALPQSVYTVWTIRPRRIPDSSFSPQADPLHIPNIILTDEKGKGENTWRVRNPFTDPELDVDGERITGLVVAWHPDFQNWGACGAILGAGVDIISQFSTVVDGTLDITPFVTVDPGDSEPDN